MGWTGSDSPGEAGTIGHSYRQAILRRINAYRAFAGLPGDAVLLTELSRMTQEGAFMMSHRDWAGHLVSPEVPFYTKQAGDAVRFSNLLLGETGPRGIDRFIEDRGAQNYAVGHRRWLLFPENRFMGVGAVPFRGFRLREALVVWVVGGNAPMPEREIDQAVLWPPPGFFPFPLVPERWSLGLADADFSKARIQVSLNGNPLPANREQVVEGMAENTLVWRFDALAGTGYEPGMAFEISIESVRFRNKLRDFVYRTELIPVD